MLFNSNKLSDVIVYNSITNTIVDEKFDTVKPFSFIEFLNYTKNSNNAIVDFDDYQVYLKKWNTVTQISYNDINAVIKQEFVNFLKTVVLNYTTSEERRYLSNIDFQNSQDLEIAAPFFATKIKQVLLYFAEKRDTYKIDLQLVKNKGSVAGVINYIKTTVLESIFATQQGPVFTTTVPLSDVSLNLQVEVEEGYDTFNNYFDLDPYEPPSFYNATGDREKYFSANTNQIDQEIFLDYSQAIINLINSERVVLEQLQSLVVSVNTPDLNLLQSYDFIDYGNRTRENLKLILNAELVKKFTGTDFYYLSTGSNGVLLSGVLFEATSPFSNLLNVNYPSTLTVPESSILFERDVGLFFKPTTQSILQLQTPFNYTVKEDLKPDYVYIFPDPYNYGNISGLSKTGHETPFQFVQQGQEIQKNISSNDAIGNSFVTKNDFTFESYHSREQNSVQSITTKLYNAGVIFSNQSDIFGNVYFGLKQQKTEYIKNFYKNVTNGVAVFGLSSTEDVVYLSSIKLLDTTGTFVNTQTRTTTSSDTTPVKSIYDLRNSPGNFYVYNIINNSINTLSSEFSEIFSKYPTQSVDIENRMFSFDVYGTTFSLTTSSYLIVDKIDYSDGKFSQTPDLPLVLKSEINNKASNVYLYENDLYVATVSLTNSPLTSGDNNRYFTLSLYSYSINGNKITNYEFLNNNENQLSYNLNTLVSVTDVKLIHNKKQGMFNVVISLKDLNNNLFINSIFLSISNGVVSIVNQKTFASNNTNLTVNFYDGSFTYNLQTYTILTTPTINSNNGTITF